ncbi:MAG: DUF4193 domain-containing protein [Acidimicrobiia bacterium]|nr:DUF4193 domain-containing protein [Acidimicrobiia bacterium]
MADTQQIDNQDAEPSDAEEVTSEALDNVDEPAVEEELLDADNLDAADDEDSDDSAALDELEAQELGMLTDDEAAETIVIDEAAELRAIRREQLELDKDPPAITTDEFVCQSCFLVKRTSQLADQRKKICTDCAG